MGDFFVMLYHPNPEYQDIAAERLRNATRQMRLLA